MAEQFLGTVASEELEVGVVVQWVLVDWVPWAGPT